MKYFVSRNETDDGFVIHTGGEVNGVMVDEIHTIKDGEEFQGQKITEDMIGEAFEVIET